MAAWMMKEDDVVPSTGIAMQMFSWLVTVTNNLARRKDHTINRCIANSLVIRCPSTNGKPDKNGICSKDVMINAERDVWVRIYYPQTASTHLPVLVHYHGGGFAILSPDFQPYDEFCKKLSKEVPCVVLSVNYRLCPEHKYPAAHDDSYEALKWLQTHDAVCHLPTSANLKSCFLCGDSAGGNLVHHVGLRAAKDRELKRHICIKGHILIQPFFGGKERTLSEQRLTKVPIISIESADWHWAAYLPPGEDRDHPIANVFGPRAESIQNLELPISMVIIGGLDILRDWQVRYAQGLLDAGKKCHVSFYKEGVHAFHIHFMFPFLAKQVRFDIVQFIRQQD